MFITYFLAKCNFFPLSFHQNEGHCGQVGTSVKQLGPCVSKIEVSVVQMLFGSMCPECEFVVMLCFFVAFAISRREVYCC